MHVLSELQNPLFDAPDRERALSALQMSRVLKANNSAKAWQAVRNMIDKAVADHNSSPRPQAQPKNIFFARQSPSLSSSTALSNPSNSNISVYPPPYRGIPSHSFNSFSRQYNQPLDLNQTPPPQPSQPPQPMQPTQAMRPEPQVLQPMQAMQDQEQPCWDDINLSNINNIVGDIQPTPGVVPDFDFVSSPWIPY